MRTLTCPIDQAPLHGLIGEPDRIAQANRQHR